MPTGFPVGSMSRGNLSAVPKITSKSRPKNVPTSTPQTMVEMPPQKRTLARSAVPPLGFFSFRNSQEPRARTRP